MTCDGEEEWSAATRKIFSFPRRVGYTTDDWQAGARHLQTDIEQHIKLTREFFEGMLGKV